ncbi:hypothetical protein LMG22037_03678 [Paraburkholderia phenoliruptrix]|uniref:Uncharacterized protein n=1 Tax=Paraburkholderia phenoliruptrix TaxID=252970 RepID=A0A6J5BIR9_9BURK|nr:HAD domain-containing protein [Paraburkholderia phenoliruptrix]CAB3704284.1 hypothetical protein LMG22037_03678 [Paraburkholderia phenoliruptrix]
MDLYLNFDGVLHPDQVLYVEGCVPSLTAVGSKTLEHVNILVKILGERENINIVLNTWWTFSIGVAACMELLPSALASRVTGSVLEGAPSYPTRPARLNEAARHILSRRERASVILDHANAVYSSEFLPKLLLIHPHEGLGNRAAQRSLERRIKLLQHIESQCVD